MGAVLHWQAFNIDAPPGATPKNKFLVVIGANQNQSVLMLVATTKRHHRSHKPGCVAEEGYYLIPGGGKDFFKEDTWLLLSEPKETNAAELIARGVKGEVQARGNLRTELVRAIINCLRRTDDVSSYHLSLT